VNFRIFDSKESLARGAAEAIVHRIESEGARVIGLSGGSTPRSVYELLGSEYRSRIENFPVVWVLEDERFVDPSDDESNRKMIEATLFKNGVPESHSWIYFETRDTEPAKAAQQFENRWSEDGIGDLDLVILGVGDDGHTASLFPGTDVLEETIRVAREVWVEKLKMWRLTLTMPVLKTAKARFVLASGENKRSVIAKVEQGESFPIADVTRGLPSTWWLVDRAAVPHP
jgi:6-phosphogluconolactonase